MESVTKMHIGRSSHRERCGLLRTKSLWRCRVLEDAHRLASRCGDNEGAGRALLVLVEEMGGLLENEEIQRIGERVVDLLSASQLSAIQRRLRGCLQYNRPIRAKNELPRDDKTLRKEGNPSRRFIDPSSEVSPPFWSLQMNSTGNMKPDSGSVC
jgi:hypothetical protein